MKKSKDDIWCGLSKFLSEIIEKYAENLEKDLKEKASKVLALQRKGAKLIFPNVLEIERKLLDK